MASTIMHIAVGNNIYKNLKDKIDIDYYDFILGTIAPDISKQLGEDKIKTHFIDDEDDIPNLDRFLDKYGESINNSFNLGYYIHLYTDKLFFRDFLPLFVKDDIFMSSVKCLDGSEVYISVEDRKDLLYNDYSNLNINLIDLYNLDLSLFYQEFRRPNTNILECYPDKLNILIDNMGTIISNSKIEKKYILDLDSVKSFIDDCSIEIYDDIKTLLII